MTKIRNKTHLIENGKTRTLRKARALALNSLEHALDAINPRILLRSKLALEGSCLRVNGCSFNFDDIRHVYIVGGGKAGGDMA